MAIKKDPLPAHSTKIRTSRPLVGILVSTESRFGREVVRGVVRFSREHRRWRFVFSRSGQETQSMQFCDAIIGSFGSGLSLEGFDRPIVNVSSRHHCPGAANICQDEVAIGRLVATYFMGRGFRQLAQVRLPSDRASDERWSGLQAGSLEAHLPAPLPFDYGPAMTGKGDWAALGAWLRSLPKPVGILCTYDELGRLVAQCCWENGIAVPEQVALVGVDNDQTTCESTIPPLSSVETGAWRIGYEAGERVQAILNGDTPAVDFEHRIRPLMVVERHSSATLAIDDPELALALRYIHDHATEGIGVSTVLEQVPMNRRRLERLFRQALGRTPHDEILRVRLEQARCLLDQTNLSIKQIARRSGFANMETFYRAFQRVYHTTPKAYARQCKAEGIRA